MAGKNISIEFRPNSCQSDNPPLHRIKRGEGKMAKKNKPKKNLSPVVNITLTNYAPSKQDEYCKKFMSPLIKGILQRVQITNVE